MGNQEVSRPVVITVIAVVVIALGYFGWYYFMRPQTYPGFRAPQSGVRSTALGGPGVTPGQQPGSVHPQTGGPR